eukprot:CAMPEP_0167750576 /NCGR_PEP_ID=MMETSP0110_2-20121227/6072_1 /TAXON_ID=629695 /ORGANISM="Gymnochlora sp., Strain CCMP2014" /LENGTH=497 /DNA_ID=CAMNT_0007635921 /DNA_START=29 /DNA_END=1523 /DNA_ORIENTATION=+
MNSSSFRLSSPIVRPLPTRTRSFTACGRNVVRRYLISSPLFHLVGGGSPELITRADIQREIDANEMQNENSERRGRKMEVNFGYTGTGYIGIQMQPLDLNGTAIADVLESALYKWGGIKEVNYRPFRQASNKTFNYTVKWTYASRTDKGVHAAANIISTKLMVNTKALEGNAGHISKEDIDKINSFLPPSVRVFDIYRVTQKANARTWALSRKYTYLVPSSAYNGDIDGFRDVLQMFVGTHKFYNFAGGLSRAPQKYQKLSWSTAKNEREKEFLKVVEDLKDGDWILIPYEKRRDKRYTRTILNITVTPYHDPQTGKDFAAVSLVGKSFVLHQIRKMLAAGNLRPTGSSSKDIAEIALNSVFYVRIPLAPSQMLFLDTVNPREDTTGGNLSVRTRPALKRTDGRWDTDRDNELAEEARLKANSFRDEVIIPHIAKLSDDVEIWNEFASACERMKEFHGNYDDLRNKMRRWEEHIEKMAELRRENIRQNEKNSSFPEQ